MARPVSTSAQLSGSRSSGPAVRPMRSSQSSIIQALAAAHTLMKCTRKASPSTGSEASTTSWPSDVQSSAAARAAAMQSGCAGVPSAPSTTSAMRRRPGGVVTAAANDGPWIGGAA